MSLNENEDLAVARRIFPSSNFKVVINFYCIFKIHKNTEGPNCAWESLQFQQKSLTLQIFSPVDFCGPTPMSKDLQDHILSTFLKLHNLKWTALYEFTADDTQTVLKDIVHLFRLPKLPFEKEVKTTPYPWKIRFN